MDDGGHGESNEERLSEVTLQCVADPREELDIQRLIQSETLTQSFHLRWSGFGTQHHCCRVAGHDVDEKECDDRYHDQHRDECCSPAKNESGHLYSRL